MSMNDEENVKKEEIIFSDFIVKIDYGIKNYIKFGEGGYANTTQRRCVLFDKKGNLIEEIINDNPYVRKIPKECIK